MARVQLKNISKHWDEAIAVDNINLSIEDGEFLSLLGPSGCGKSTTLLMLAGIYTPSAGEIRFDDIVVNDIEARQRNISIVFQSYALYPNMTALQNIMFPLRFQKVENADGLAREMAELVQVSDLLTRRPSEMSGGQQQRVALARALVKRPQLLLLDEPLSNLDATLRLTMRAEIKRITRELNLTTILVTHDQLESTTMSDRIAVMNKGRIEQIGKPEDLYRKPDTLFVSSFIGSPPVNHLTGVVTDGAMTEDGSQITLSGAENGEVTVAIRPEDLRPVREESAGISGTISHIEPMGREVLIGIDTAFGHVRMLQSGSTTKYAVGGRITVTCRQADAIVFDSQGMRRDDVSARLRKSVP